MPFQCVPFDPEWAKEGCPDIKAIYRRPARDEFWNPLRGADGTPRWDITGALPIRRHADWLAKGFEYVTLASNEDLMDGGVLASLRRRGLEPATFLNGPRRQVWVPLLYQQEAAAQAQRDVADLETLVKEFGSDAVLKIKRQSDPGFELPDHLKGRKAKGAAA